MEEKIMEKAVPMALSLFEKFYNELTTALINSAKCCKGAMWNPNADARSILYNEGKKDAFEEIAYRIQKEFNLVLNHSIDPRNITFGNVRDADIERMIPERDIRFRRDYGYVMKYRRALAELLESYMMEGFRMGYKFGSTEDKEALKFEPQKFSDACIEAFVHPLFKERDKQ